MLRKWRIKLAICPKRLNVLSTRLWSESACLAASEEEDDAVVQVVLEQILGHNRVNHQLKAAATCRVNDINNGVEIELLDPLGILDPVSSRNGRVSKAWCIYND